MKQRRSNFSSSCFELRDLGDLRGKSSKRWCGLGGITRLFHALYIVEKSNEKLFSLEQREKTFRDYVERSSRAKFVYIYFFNTSTNNESNEGDSKIPSPLRAFSRISLFALKTMRKKRRKRKKKCTRAIKLSDGLGVVNIVTCGKKGRRRRWKYENKLSFVLENFESNNFSSWRRQRFAGLFWWIFWEAFYDVVVRGWVERGGRRA